VLVTESDENGPGVLPFPALLREDSDRFRCSPQARPASAAPLQDAAGTVQMLKAVLGYQGRDCPNQSCSAPLPSLACQLSLQRV
jgi:hypothetical protein